MQHVNILNRLEMDSFWQWNTKAFLAYPDRQLHNKFNLTSNWETTNVRSEQWLIDVWQYFQMTNLKKCSNQECFFFLFCHWNAVFTSHSKSWQDQQQLCSWLDTEWWGLLSALTAERLTTFDAGEELRVASAASEESNGRRIMCFHVSKKTKSK